MLSPPVLIALSLVCFTLRALAPWVVGLIVYFASGRDLDAFKKVSRLNSRETR